MKKAIPKEEFSTSHNPLSKKNKKVFLGGLPLDATKEDIMPVVEEYGDIFEVMIMTEKGTEKPRGFGFAVYKDYSGAEAICRVGRIKINVSMWMWMWAVRSVSWVFRVSEHVVLWL